MLVPPEPFALRVAVPPIHIGPLLVGAAIGVGFTVTLIVVVAVAEPSETCMVNASVPL